MKSVSYDSLGFAVALSVPESVTEFDTLAGRSGACLDEATDNCVYRGSLADFRSAFILALEKESGVTINRVQKKNAKGEPQFDADKNPIMVIDETEGDYVKRVKGQLALEDEAFAAKFQPIASAVAAKLVFDPKATERKAKTPPKTYLEAADSVITGGGTFEKAAGKLAAELGYEVPATREGVAFALQAREAKRRAAVVADLIS